MRTLTVLLMLLSLSATAGQVYRWVDAQGNVNYTDQPPPPGAKGSTQKSFKGSSSENSVTGNIEQAKLKNPVTLYTTATCGVLCDRAKAHLDRRGIPYSTKDPSTSVDANEALRVGGSQARVPTMLIGNQKLEGYTERAWDAALDSAGYLTAPPVINP